MPPATHQLVRQRRDENIIDRSHRAPEWTGLSMPEPTCSWPTVPFINFSSSFHNVTEIMARLTTGKATEELMEIRARPSWTQDERRTGKDRREGDRRAFPAVLQVGQRTGVDRRQNGERRKSN